MRTIALTYVVAGHGTSAKPSITFAAGEAIRLSLTPTVSTDMTGKTFRLVISDTPGDAPLVNSTTFSFISASVGTLYFDLADTASFEWATGNYNLEIWNATDDILLRRAVAKVTANPRASGDAPAYPDPPIDWTDIANVDATLTALAGLTIAANTLTIGTGADSFSQTTFAANTFPARASTGSLEAKTITDFGLSLVDDANAATARATLGGTTVGQSLFTLANPSAVTFLRANADNTVSALSASDFRAAIGAGVGDVVGPASALDHAIVRFNGTTGKLIEDSGLNLADNGDMQWLAGSVADGGIINLIGGSGTDAVGGNLTTSGGTAANASGGTVNTSGVTLPGGNITTSNGGGSIDTRGTGSIQFGATGTRTTLVGQAASDITVSLPATPGTLAITENLSTTTSSAAPAPVGSSARNYFSVTALAEAATFAAPSGTPANGNRLLIRVKDNGTGRALSFNAIYRAIGVTLPTTTVANKTLYLGAVYNSADSKWDVIAYGVEA